MKIEIDKLLEERMEEILQGTAEIVAETSVGYFQDTFRHKAFDGNPWAPPRVPKQSGSLLVQSGALLNSIRPVVITPGRIVIAAGNEKVDYARVHNEGFKGAVAVPAHIRHTRRGDQSVRQYTRRVNIPRRQFIGDARELETELQKRIETHVESVLNN